MHLEKQPLKNQSAKTDYNSIDAALAQARKEEEIVYSRARKVTAVVIMEIQLKLTRLR